MKACTPSANSGLAACVSCKYDSNSSASSKLDSSAWDRTLGGGKRLAGLRDELSGELSHLRFEAVRRHQPVDDAEPVRICRRQWLASEEHLVSHAGARQAWKQPADTTVRSQANVDESLQ